MTNNRHERVAKSITKPNFASGSLLSRWFLFIELPVRAYSAANGLVLERGPKSIHGSLPQSSSNRSPHQAIQITRLTPLELGLTDLCVTATGSLRQQRVDSATE